MAVAGSGHRMNRHVRYIFPALGCERAASTSRSPGRSAARTSRLSPSCPETSARYTPTTNGCGRTRPSPAGLPGAMIFSISQGLRTPVIDDIASLAFECTLVGPVYPGPLATPSPRARQCPRSAGRGPARPAASPACKSPSSTRTGPSCSAAPTLTSQPPGPRMWDRIQMTGRQPGLAGGSRMSQSGVARSPLDPAPDEAGEEQAAW